jgi:CHASE3 domain sensor protein
MSEQSFQEQMNNIDQWLSELQSLGVSPKRKNSMNDKKELRDLTENIKQELYQEYKAAYAEA